jgi:hypothetical protein
MADTVIPSGIALTTTGLLGGEPGNGSSVPDSRSKFAPRRTGTLGLSEAQVRLIQAQDEERERQRYLQSLADTYSNPRDKNLVRAIQEQRQIAEKNTAIQDYMRTGGAVAAPQGLLTKPEGIVAKYADVGADVAFNQKQSNSISGLLGDVDWRGIMGRLMETFQRPEMLTPGVNALTSFGMAGSGLRQSQLAGAAAEQEKQTKLELARIKATPGAPKITAEGVKLYDRINTQRRALGIIQKMKLALGDGTTTGIVGSGTAALKGIANAFNVDLGKSAQGDYNAQLAALKIALRKDGRLLKGDLDMFEKVLPEAGATTSVDAMLTSLRRAQTQAEDEMYAAQQILITYGMQPGSGARPASAIRSRGN